jgi:hypothetical protein
VDKTSERVCVWNGLGTKQCLGEESDGSDDVDEDMCFDSNMLLVKFLSEEIFMCIFCLHTVTNI